MEDQELVRQILYGNTAVFAMLIKNTEGLVAQIVSKMVYNAEDRKDLAQDIYLKAYRNIKNFKHQSKLSTWIASIAYNTCYNYLEKKKLILPENKSTAGETDESLLETLANRFVDLSSNETLKKLFRSELSTALQSAIHQLPPIYNILITLFHYQELSYQEIAEITGLPEGTLKNYLFRARKTLKDYIILNYKKEDL